MIPPKTCETSGKCGYVRRSDVDRLKIQFFPKHDIRKLDGSSMVYELKRFDSFYTDRELRIEDRGQLRLF